MPISAPAITYRVSPTVGSDELNALFAAAWEGHTARDFAPILARSLAYVCAYVAGELVGFVNLPWDGGIHAFLLDTTVHPAHQRQGIGSHLVTLAAAEARRCGIRWLHVDYEPHLEAFYRGCGFQPSPAGVMRL